MTPIPGTTCELELKRHVLSQRSSIGELFLNGLSFCFTCEDKTRGPKETKVFGETAIPVGRYEVVINRSPRFGVEMPLLLDVPGFQGVRIHPGNKPEDTEGCILVGYQRGVDQVTESRDAYNDLFPKLQAAINFGQRIFITITVEEDTK